MSSLPTSVIAWHMIHDLCPDFPTLADRIRQIIIFLNENRQLLDITLRLPSPSTVQVRAWDGISHAVRENARPLARYLCRRWCGKIEKIFTESQQKSVSDKSKKPYTFEDEDSDENDSSF